MTLMDLSEPLTRSPRDLLVVLRVSPSSPPLPDSIFSAVQKEITAQWRILPGKVTRRRKEEGRMDGDKLQNGLNSVHTKC